MDLWHATEGIWVLHMYLMALDEFTALEQFAETTCSLYLSKVWTYYMDGM